MKKVLLSLAMMLTCVMTQAHDVTDNWWEDSLRFTTAELNQPIERRIAIKGVWHRPSPHGYNYNKFYSGTNSAIENNPVAKDYLLPENIFIWEPDQDGTAFYLKKAYYTNENQAYLLRTTNNDNIGSFGARTNPNVVKFVAAQATAKPDADFYISNPTDEDLLTVIRLKVHDQTLYLNTGNLGYRPGTGSWSVHHILDVADYRMVTIRSTKYSHNADGTTSKEISEVKRMYKPGATIEIPEYDGYTHNIKVGANAYTKDETDYQVIDVTYLPIYTPTALATPTTKRIAVRSVGETGQAYNQFYTATGNPPRATLPLTENMIFDLVPVDPANSETKFYMKRAFENDKYVQNGGSTQLGDINGAAQFEICNITTIGTNPNNNNKHQFNKSNVHTGYDDTYIQTYGVRFAYTNTTYLNVNSTEWSSGIGIWSVQLAVDASCYHKYTLNIIRPGDDGEETTETIIGVQRIGDDIDIPAYFGYIYDGDAITMTDDDDQVYTLRYSKMNYEAAEITPGNYFIYYQDEDGTKHFLQTQGEHNVVTVTDEPMYYDIKNGNISNGQYSHAYFLEMNDLRIQNTVQRGTQIQTSPKTSTRLFESQVFLQTEEIPGCYAIRLTNSTDVSAWHEYYFIAKGEQYGTTMGVDPDEVAPQDRYIWHLDAVTGRDIQIVALRNCLKLVRETYYNAETNEWLLRDGANFYDAELLSVYEEALEFYNNITDETPDADIEAMYNKLENKRDGTDINEPELNKFYRIRCCDDTQTTPYISAVQANHTDGTNRFTMVALDANDPNTIFFYYNDDDHIGDDDHSHEGTHLVSLSKGRSIECHDFVSVGDASKVAFFAANNNAMCQYNISFTTASHNHEQRWIYGAKSHNLIDGGNDTPSTTDGDGYNWQLEEVTTLPIVIKAAGYATLYSPLALTLPENSGLEVYYATATTASDMKLTALEGNVIPAETGVILKGEAGTYMLTIGGEPAETMTNNLLHGTVVPEYIAEEIFVLAQTENGVGMAKAMATEGHANEYINNAFKAYMPASLVQTPGARFLNFNLGGGDETGIEGLLDTEAQSTVTYDLSGRRVLKAAKGLYIVNGQKVVK